MIAQVLHSREDQTVNFVRTNGQESRYVRRGDDYFIAYMSSHNGCNKACRFCHLTQTKQTQFVESTFEEMCAQAQDVVDHYKSTVKEGKQKTVKAIHFNWMARGEPLSSKTLAENWTPLTLELKKMATEAGVDTVRFNLSSIMPTDLVDLGDVCDNSNGEVTIFYSLYSLDQDFRKRWLPNAMVPTLALKHLRFHQITKKLKVVLHWAFIEGENDSQETCDSILSLVEASELEARFNLVRYNPYSAGQGVESPGEVLADRFEFFEKSMIVKGSRIVPRVGFDVKASCGMFVSV